ncbi:MAG: hypothetical protein ACRCZP_19210 [Phycicoccus sp.]
MPLTLLGFPYPNPADDTDVPDDLGKLAVAVDGEVTRRGIVGRNRRITTFTTAGTIAACLSCRAPVVTGRSYLIGSHYDMSAVTAPATTQNELRATTNDTEPTTTSTLIGRTLTDHRVSGVPDSVDSIVLYPAAHTGWLRVLLCTQRVIGSGNINLEASAGFPADLYVMDLGPTPAVSGTVY